MSTTIVERARVALEKGLRPFLTTHGRNDEQAMLIVQIGVLGELRSFFQPGGTPPDVADVVTGFIKNAFAVCMLERTGTVPDARRHLMTMVDEIADCIEAHGAAHEARKGGTQ